MAVFLAAVGAVTLLILIGLVVGLARRLAQLGTALTALQRELEPVLETIKTTSEETQRLAGALEERARVLRRDRG
jgi:hypothetical protein